MFQFEHKTKKKNINNNSLLFYIQLYGFMFFWNPLVWLLDANILQKVVLEFPLDML